MSKICTPKEQRMYESRWYYFKTALPWRNMCGNTSLLSSNAIYFSSNFCSLQIVAVNWSPAFEGTLSVPEVRIAMYICTSHTSWKWTGTFFQNIIEQVAPFLLAAVQKLMVTCYTLAALSVPNGLEPSPTLSSVVCFSYRYDLVSVLAGEMFSALKSRVFYKLRRLLIIL